MTLTTQEEEILKLTVAKIKAQHKLNAVNQEMGDKIRAEFKSIDDRIRLEHKPIFTPLEDEIKTIEADLIAKSI